MPPFLEGKHEARKYKAMQCLNILAIKIAKVCWLGTTSGRVKPEVAFCLFFYLLIIIFGKMLLLVACFARGQLPLWLPLRYATVIICMYFLNVHISLILVRGPETTWRWARRCRSHCSRHSSHSQYPHLAALSRLTADINWSTRRAVSLVH